MSEQNLKAIALFFFFAFLDEKIALDASIKITNKFRDRVSKHPDFSEAQSQTLLVQLTKKYFFQHRHRSLRHQTALTGHAGWQVPTTLDLSAWKQFQKESSENDFLAVIWSKILGFSDESISEGLGVTVGTVRYRIGNGLRALGAMNKFKTLTKS